MSKYTIPQVYVGIDISKDRLDLCLMPGDRRLTFSNDTEGLSQLADRLSKEVSPLIVMEATGGYDVPIAGTLLSKGLPAAIVNPRRVRDFARAMGKLAKTDSIESHVRAIHLTQVSSRCSAKCHLVRQNTYYMLWRPDRSG